MGLSFDDNGRYIGWSNLFDISSIETLEASEKLPQPKHLVYNFISNEAKLRASLTSSNTDPTLLESLNNIVDINIDVNNIEKVDNLIKKDPENNKLKAKRIELYANLLNKLYKVKPYEHGGKNNINVSYHNKYGNKVL